MLIKKKSPPCFLLFHGFVVLVAFFISSSFSTVHAKSVAPLVKKEERRLIVSTEYGEISAARISDGVNATYLLHFFKLEPNSLFLPVILNADMVLYVHTGTGQLTWAEDEELKSIDLRQGVVYRLLQRTLFFIHCNSEAETTEQQALRIHAIFANSNEDLQEPATEPYSSIQEMVLGFNKKVLQATFKVSEEVIDELLNGTKPRAIVPVDPAWEMEAQAQITEGFLESRSHNRFKLHSKKKKAQARIFTEDKDVENCNGWIITVTKKKLSALKGSNISLFMVNLTAGSMMAPHWNPMSSEVVIVLEGWGMVRVVCPSISEETDCRNMRFRVEEGDVFAVPRLAPMAQMAFNNDTYVFMGFSTITERNQAQFLAGEASVLRTLNKDVLAMSFNIANTTVDELLAPRDESSVIVSCTSCAEEELRIMEEGTEEEGGEIEEEGQREEEGPQEEESETEEDERRGGGGSSSEEEPPRTQLRHENQDDEERGRRRISKNNKRRTV